MKRKPIVRPHRQVRLYSQTRVPVPQRDGGRGQVVALRRQALVRGVSESLAVPGASVVSDQHNLFQLMFSLTGEPEQKETGKPATAQTDENGNFELSTFSNYDGALVGNHTVHVTLDDTNPAKCKRSKALALDVKPGSNEFTIEMDPPR